MKKTIYTPDRQSLSSRLVKAREEASLTQKQVQDTLDISQSELSKIEKGQRKVESLTLEKLAKLYRKPLSYFISEITDENSENPINYWVFKTVADDERSYRSIEGYDDELENKYVYDSAVANSKQVQAGDIAVIVNKESVLGFVRISRITVNPGKKTRRRCPECGSTNYEERKTKHPPFRCNHGDEFFEPRTDVVEIEKYSAYYGSSFLAPKTIIPVKDLRPYFHNNYNRNMSIQSLSESFFNMISPDIHYKLMREIPYPGPIEASDSFADKDSDYNPTDLDEREIVKRQIKARRGAEKFRTALIDRYNGACVVTGCKILELLEAAHIKPYRGPNDNHPSNGLLLRADIHTLFDLDLIGIDPETLTIQINNEIMRDGYQTMQDQPLNVINYKNRPNIKALRDRWAAFKNNL